MIAVVGAIAGVRLSTGAIYLIASIPLVIAALIASVIWRSAKRERASRALRSRLESPNPQTRRDAIDAVTDDVLEEHAEMLCELLDTESNDDVLDALAAAVARSKWEPTDDAGVLRLRRWVAGGKVRSTSSSSAVASAPVANADATEARQPKPVPADSPVPVQAAAATAPSASTNGRESPPSEPGSVPAPVGDPAELVDRVREVLGDGVERVELVSIDGELLASWSSAQGTHAEGPRSGESA
jgi:hypothetical protein